MRFVRISLTLSLGTALLSIVNATGRAGHAVPRPDLIIVRAPVVRGGPVIERFPKGSQLVRLTSASASPSTLTSDYFAAADPQVSFDGARVLFSGKKAADATWQIWEMNLDGSAPRQVTHCPEDCLKPAYLPRGEIVFTGISKSPQESQLWVSRIDGSDAHQITFGPGNFESETVLMNGMVLATADYPLLPAHGRVADRELYTVRSDGTALATLRCDHQHPSIRNGAEELDNGAVVFVKSPPTSSNPGGEIAWIRRGALHNSPLVAPPQIASAPHPLAGDQLVVSRESAAGAREGTRLALYAFNAGTGKFGARLYEDPKLSAAEAVPVASHEPPRWYWSTLDPKLDRGYFVCMDAYQAEGFPQGRIPAKLAKIRVWILNSTTQKESALGEAPVEADGSFYIAVPPDKPVRFELLDAGGHVVRAQKSWIWARSGEEHGCVGCHENRALAPENRWPLALRSFDTPTRLDEAAGGEEKVASSKRKAEGSGP